MTELESKLVDKILEKLDLDKLIEKIGYDVLTDKIAEKAAELIVQKEYPPYIPPSTNPISPWRMDPITVMYGCTPTQLTGDFLTDSITSKSSDYEVQKET